MIYMICDFWNILYFSRYFSTTCFQSGSTEKGLRHFSFRDVFRTFWNLGACLPFRKFPNFWVTISLYKKECLPESHGIKNIHRSKLYPWYTHLGKTFLQLPLFKVCETFLFRQSKKVSSILWSVWVFFAFLEKRRPNR